MVPLPAPSVGVRIAPSSPNDTGYYLTGGLKGVRYKQYRGRRSFINTMDKQADKGQSGNTGHYVVFCPVTQAQLGLIDQIRDEERKGLRFLYLNREQALIVKVIIGAAHEIANRRFATLVAIKMSVMGLRNDFIDMGGTTITAPGGRKEGDSTFTPNRYPRPAQCWPTLVLECGVSQSLARLTVDSQWWLTNSSGETNIVILISVSAAHRHIHWEKWEAVVTPNPRVTRANPNAFRSTPTKTHKLDIVGDVVTGAPMRLEFEKIMLRHPVGGEGDIIFNTKELQEFASIVWDSTQDAPLKKAKS